MRTRVSGEGGAVEASAVTPPVSPFGAGNPSPSPAVPSPSSPLADQLLSDKVSKLYVVLISLHGLVRGQHMELGRDPDTGDWVRV